MGYMMLKKEGHEVLWGDHPQDMVDGYLKEYKKKLKTRTMTVYKKAIKDKKLKEKLNKIFQKDFGRNAKQVEIQLHVCTGLNKDGAPKACEKFEKYRPIAQRKYGELNIDLVKLWTL